MLNDIIVDKYQFVYCEKSVDSIETIWIKNINGKYSY
jgi:hypothetical protein